MKILKCETCGSNLILSDDGMHAHCDVCGNVYEYKNPKEDYFIEQMNEANDLRQAMDFDDAIKKYRMVIKAKKDDAEAHFGLLLSKYGVAYEIDPFTEEYIPTFHRNMRGDIARDEDAVAAIANASDTQKDVYKAQIAELRRIQEGIEKVASECKPYDVFVSFKATDADGNNTTDRDIAYNIYDELNTRGVRTFFSEVSLMDMASSDYEAVIFNALNTCKVFILVATSKENINSTWVKNEWTRFREIVAEDMKSGVKAPQHFAVVGRDMKPNELPLIFAKTQNIMLAKYAGDSYKKDVALSVEKILGIEKTKSQDVNVKIDDTKVAEMVAKMVGDKVGKATKKQSPDVAYQRLSAGKNRPEGIFARTANLNAVSIEIDDSYMGEPVIGIMDNGFENSRVKYLSMPDTIKYIGDNAFNNCAQLSEFNISKSLEYVAETAFDSCAALRSFPDIGKTALSTIPRFLLRFGLNAINVPDNVLTIEDGFFENATSLRSINFGANSKLRNIGERAFAGSGISTISLPSTIVSIGNDAFEGCANLKKIDNIENTHITKLNRFFGTCPIDRFVVPKSVKTIDANVFKASPVKAVVFDKNTEISVLPTGCFAGSEITSIEIPDSVKVIEEEAFNNCERLASVVFGAQSALEKIGKFSFAYTNLKSIKLPKSVVEIGDEAFSYNNDLMEIDCDFDNIKVLGRGCLGTNSEKIISKFIVGNTLTLPKNLEILGDVFFQNIQNINTIVFGDKIKTIGAYNFANTKIIKLDIPESLMDIGEGAFMNCKSLKTVNIPKEFFRIGDKAFEGCDALAEVNLPENAHLTHIGARAFFQCTALEKINNIETSNLSTIGVEAFSKSHITSFICYERLRSIGSKAFYECTSLRVLLLGTNVTKCGMEIATLCPSLECFGIAGSFALQRGMLTEMEWKKCECLFIGGDISKIRENHYTNKGNLLVNHATILCLNNGSKNYDWAFCSNDAYNIDNITIVNNIVYALNYEKRTAKLIRKLDSNTDSELKIPATIEYRGEEFTIDEIGDHSIYFGFHLTSIELPNTLQKINAYSIYWTHISEITIPESVNYIGYYAFDDNSKIKIYVPSKAQAKTWCKGWYKTRKKFLHHKVKYLSK